MPDFYFSFMTPDVWNALVLASIFIGLAFAALRLMKDRAAYTYHQRRQALPAHHDPGHSRDQEQGPGTAAPTSGTKASE